MRWRSLLFLTIAWSCGGSPGAGGKDAGGKDAAVGASDASSVDAAHPEDAAIDAGVSQDAQAGSDADVGQDAAMAHGYCATCVSSSDCGGALCVGGIEPRCGLDCSHGQACSADATCDTYGLGTGPRLGSVCGPTVGACGAFVRDPSLNCSDTWDTYGQAFFVNTCIGACHRHDGAWSTVGDVRGSADSLRFAIETQSMPQAMSLTPEERRRFMTWIACGAP
ncbi:MAG: hypothetical protein U1E65_28115 [Myxococcota bacterium]